MAREDDDFFDDEEDFKDEAEEKSESSSDDDFDDDPSAGDEGDEGGEGEDEELGPEMEGEEGEDDEFREKKKVKKAPADDNGKFVQIDGTVVPTKRDLKGAVIEICLDAGKTKYPIILDNMGKNLLKMCFNQIFVGAIIRIENGVKSLEIKNYI